MCFGGSDPAPTPQYRYESFTENSKDRKPVKTDRPQEAKGDMKPTTGDSLGSTTAQAGPSTIAVGAQERKPRAGGTVLGNY